MSQDRWLSVGDLIAADRKEQPVQGWERTVEGRGEHEGKERAPLTEARRAHMAEYNRARRAREKAEREA